MKAVLSALLGLSYAWHLYIEENQVFIKFRKIRVCEDAAESLRGFEGEAASVYFSCV